VPGFTVFTNDAISMLDVSHVTDRVCKLEHYGVLRIRNLFYWLARQLSCKRLLLSVSVCLLVCVSATLMLYISETEPFMGSSQ